jgi:hypothetical protein
LPLQDKAKRGRKRGREDVSDYEAPPAAARRTEPADQILNSLYFSPRTGTRTGPDDALSTEVTTGIAARVKPGAGPSTSNSAVYQDHYQCCSVLRATVHHFGDADADGVVPRCNGPSDKDVAPELVEELRQILFAITRVVVAHMPTRMKTVHNDGCGRLIYWLKKVKVEIPEEILEAACRKLMSTSSDTW